METRRLAFGAAGLALLVLLASLLPPSVKHALHTEGPLHPWIHLGIFLLLGYLGAQAVPSARLRLMLLLAIIALGWGTEFLESLRDGWPVERHDGLLDTLGVVLGGVLGSAALARRQANPR